MFSRRHLGLQQRHQFLTLIIFNYIQQYNTRIYNEASICRKYSDITPVKFNEIDGVSEDQMFVTMIN